MEWISVIMHKGEVYHGKFFENIQQARNYVKMSNPKKKFKEPLENLFIDIYYGSKYQVMVLTSNKTLESQLRDGITSDMAERGNG